MIIWVDTKKLTAKQQAFADYYIETTNASESARRAGYSSKTAHRIGQENMQKPAILTYIEERMSEASGNRIMSAQEALELLTGIARAEITEEVYIATEQGVQRVEKTPDIKDRQRAIDSLLKRYPINRHEELRNQMLEAQVEKLQRENSPQNNVEDKLKDYFTALGSAFRGN